MKKRIFIQISIALICLFFCFSIYTNEKYDMPIGDYVKYSLPYSQAEKEYLEDKQVLYYGCDSNAPPLSFSEDGKRIEGLIVDYMASISIECGIPLQNVTAPWNETIANLKTHKVDMVDMFPTEKRAKEFAFTQPIYTLNGAIVVVNDKFEAIEDLEGKTFAVVEGDFAQEEFDTILRNDPSKGYKIKAYGSIEECLVALEKGKVDAAAGDEAVLAYMINFRENSASYNIISHTLYSNDVTLAVDKDDEILLDVLNKTILRLKEKDVLTKAQEKWYGIASPIIKQPSKYNIALAISVIAIIALLFILLWNDAMKRTIAEKTNDVEKSRQNLQTIINTLNNFLFTYNSEGKIKECNNALEQLLGVEKDQLLNTNIADYDLLEEIAMADELFTKRQIEFRGRYYDVVKSPISIEGEETLIVFEDVTNEVLYNKRLRQESKMEAVSHLSAGLAHEIRNPLGIIRNYLYILRSKVSDDIGVQAVEAANTSVNRINSLITNLLKFSKIGSDEKALYDCAQILRDIISLEEKNVKEKGILVELEADGDTKVMAGEESLKIIFVNLIDNAIESFRDENSDKRLIINVAGNDEEVVVKIRDTGKGMEEKQVENVFDPFFTTKESGTGLGLYIVQSEVKKLDGTIDVESRKNEGTQFTLHFKRG